MIPKLMTLWPWPLTYLSKNPNLCHNFESLEVELSYFTCIFFVIMPLRSSQKNWPSNLDLDLWPTYLTTLTLAYFWFGRDRDVIFGLWHRGRWLWILAWPLIYISKNLKDHNFWTVRGKDFIFGMHTQIMKTFKWNKSQREFGLYCRRGHSCYTITCFWL